MEVISNKKHRGACHLLIKFKIFKHQSTGVPCIMSPPSQMRQHTVVQRQVGGDSRQRMHLSIFRSLTFVVKHSSVWRICVMDASGFEFSDVWTIRAHRTLKLPTKVEIESWTKSRREMFYGLVAMLLVLCFPFNWKFLWFEVFCGPRGLCINGSQLSITP